METLKCQEPFSDNINEITENFINGAQDIAANFGNLTTQQIKDRKAILFSKLHNELVGVQKENHQPVSWRNEEEAKIKAAINDIFTIEEIALQTEKTHSIKLAVGAWVEDGVGVVAVTDDGEKVISDITGRIISIATTTTTTQKERETGEPDPHKPQGQQKCELRLEWGGGGGFVRGNAAILASAPANWAKEAEVSAAVLTHPTWPPERHTGILWRQAIKAHRADEIEYRTLVRNMGWAPIGGGKMAFVIGGQAIGADGETTEIALDFEACGGNAAEFGTQIPQSDTELRAALEIVVENVLALHANPGIGAVTLATIARPAIPIRPQTSVFDQAEPGAGKSMLQSFSIAGWADSPGRFHEKHMPGSATDSLASQEHQRAHLVIQVFDDFAPSASPTTSERQEDAIASGIRGTETGNARGLQRSDGTAKERKTPQVFGLYSGENLPRVASILDRTIVRRLGSGGVGFYQTRVETLKQIRDVSGEFRLITGGLLVYLARRGAEIGWSNLVAEWRVKFDQLHHDAKAKFLADGAEIGAADRHAHQVADIGIGLVVIEELAAQADLDLTAPIEEALTALTALVAETHQHRNADKPGAKLLAAVSGFFHRGRGYLAPVGENAPDFATLGWHYRHNGQAGEWVPPSGAIKMGYAGGGRVGLFPSIFKEVASELPAGTTAQISWLALREEGFGDLIASYRKDRPYVAGWKVAPGQTRDIVPISAPAFFLGRAPDPEPAPEPGSDLANLKTKLDRLYPGSPWESSTDDSALDPWDDPNPGIPFSFISEGND